MVAKVCKVLSVLLLIFLLLLAALLVGPHLVGVKTFVVLSGSMEPAIHVGGLVFTKECTPDQVQAGDVITFTMSGSEVMATHRVLEDRPQEQGFITKGDANDSDDGLITYDRLLGRVVWSVPYLGFLVTMMQGRERILIIAGVLVLLIILNALPQIFKKEPASNGQTE